MDQNNFLTFEEYKGKIFEMARLKNRTKEEKEEDMRIARQKAKNALNILNKKNDIHKPKKIIKQKTSKFIK
jgi:lipocalin